MNIYLDTSALLAVLNADDRYHAMAKNAWEKLLLEGAQLYLNNYVLIETFTLLQSRFGLEAVRLFQSDILPVLEIAWVDEATHNPAVSALLAANRRSLSLVDCTSFETMRQLGLSDAFALDNHFKEQGFEVIPLLESK
jgi:predicted nucleic acid-binding protein